MANETIVGFVGLGTMGAQMAANLQKAGYKLVVHDLHRQSASHHLQAGAIWAETPKALAAAMRRDLLLAARAARCRGGGDRRRTACSTA